MVLKQISYEIIWEADRIDPKNEYFELLAHPENMIPCTPKEEIANKNKTENGNSNIEWFGLKGINNQSNKVIKNEKTGAKKNMKILELEVYNNSFPINFKASANGCKIPNIPTIFGPLLLWILLITLRSNNVKNAIHNIINIKIIKLFINNIKSILYCIKYFIN